MSDGPFVAPASFAQERLWFLDRLDPGSCAYNVPAVIPLPAATDREVLAWCLAELVTRHEALRTRFGMADGEAVQIIEPRLDVRLEVVDLRGLSADEARRRSAERAEAEAKTPFDLAAGPLLRATLLQRRADQVLLLTLHHIIADGWSLGVLLRELSQLYEARTAGRGSPLAPLAIQYADYTHWQRQRLQGPRYAELAAWWRERLAGAPSVLEIPTDFPRPASPSSHGATRFFELGPELSAAIRKLSAAETATPFMVLLAAFEALIYRYTRCEDLLVGTPIANRGRVELEGLVGFFANTIVIRGRPRGGQTFRQLAAELRQATLEAFDHQDMPFERLVSELDLERHTNRNPLFQVMFSLQNTPTLRTASLPEAAASGTGDPTSSTAKFDLALLMGTTQDGFSGGLEYSTELFAPETIAAMVERFTALLGAVTAAPDTPLDAIPLASAAEAGLVAQLGRGPRPADGSIRALHHLFEASADRAPDAPAAECEGARLTYGALDRRANGVAMRLLDRGLEPGARVGICLGRGLDALAAVLGVLKTGGAYVPLDPAHPPHRLAQMIAEAELELVLTDAEGEAALAGLGAPTQRLAGELPEEPLRPPRVVDPASLAYVVFTSGSTGRPKAVGLRHAEVSGLITWMADRPMTTLWFASLGFDVSVQELFVTWASGAMVVVAPEQARRDPRALWSLVEHTGVERLFLPPVVLQHACHLAPARPPASVREVVCAGEQLRITPEIVELFSALPGAVLVNQYGPCETHVVTEARLAGDPARWPALPPIGRPIPGVELLLLDPGSVGSPRRLTPLGLPGELCIAGLAAGRDYLGHARGRGDRFVPDPRDGPGLIYRTGDLARFRHDGELQFLGRIDDQVKIRGHRVEPAAIDAVLVEHPGVKAAATIARGPDDDRRLISYVIPAGAPPSPAELLLHCRQRLPHYMVPVSITAVAELPLTAHGKLDRERLPDPAPAHPDPGTTHTAPRTPVEQELAAVWAEILELPQVGVHDDFFALGGHSLLAVRLVARICDEYQVELPLRALFDRPTIAELAPILVAHRAALVDDADMIRLLAEIDALPEDDASGHLHGAGQPGDRSTRMRP